MGKRVLVVDDDLAIGHLLEVGLNASGFEVAVQARAADAIQAMDGQDFDAVISDLMMPGMDGIQLCERVVASRPDVPVLIMTAYATLGRAIAALRAGAYDFILKPLQIPVVATRLEHAVQHRNLREEVQRLHVHRGPAIEDPGELVSMEEIEKRYIRRVMTEVGGNKTLAARILGFDRRTLYRKLERHGLVETQEGAVGGAPRGRGV